jgi:hypothetical protein
MFSQLLVDQMKKQQRRKQLSGLGFLKTKSPYDKMKMCWTPGSPQLCFHSLYLVGQMT